MPSAPGRITPSKMQHPIHRPPHEFNPKATVIIFAFISVVNEDRSAPVSAIILRRKLIRGPWNPGDQMVRHLQDLGKVLRSGIPPQRPHEISEKISRRSIGTYAHDRHRIDIQYTRETEHQGASGKSFLPEAAVQSRPVHHSLPSRPLLVGNRTDTAVTCLQNPFHGDLVEHQHGYKLQFPAGFATRRSFEQTPIPVRIQPRNKSRTQCQSGDCSPSFRLFLPKQR